MTKVQTLESKLQFTLEELQNKNNLCKKLLEEREENEQELLIIINRNTTLKNEMSALYTKYKDVEEKCNQLQAQIEAYSDCNNTYEQALLRISYLEKELQQAQSVIHKFEEEKKALQSEKTMNLFNELVSSHSKQPICNAVTSRKNRKQYFKTQKIIKKLSFKSRNFKVLYKNYNLLKKENRTTIEKLDLYKNKITVNLAKYNYETSHMQSELLKLRDALHNITMKYNSAQGQIQGHISAATELLDLCTYNEERFHSLVNKNVCNCGVGLSGNDNTQQNVLTFCDPCHTTDSIISPYEEGHDKFNNTRDPDVLLFSDDIGIGMGSRISNYTKQNILNNCSPGISFTHIVEKIRNIKINDNCTLVLLLSEYKNLKKSDILKCIKCLLDKNVKKIVLCAFPYSSSYSRAKNQRIYYINNLMYQLTCCHSDKLFFFDINKFITNLVVTKRHVHLHKKYKDNVAKLLAYNIDIFYNYNCNSYTLLTMEKAVNFKHRDSENLNCSYANRGELECNLLSNSIIDKKYSTPDLNLM